MARASTRSSGSTPAKEPAVEPPPTEAIPQVLSTPEVKAASKSSKLPKGADRTSSRKNLNTPKSVPEPAVTTERPSKKVKLDHYQPTPAVDVVGGQTSTAAVDVKPPPSPQTDPVSQVPSQPLPINPKTQEEEDRCLACTADVPPSPKKVLKEEAGSIAPNTAKGISGGGNEVVWLCCSKCNSWYHYGCIRLNYPSCLPSALGPDEGKWEEEAEKIDKWYCFSDSCQHLIGTASLKKEPSRKSSRAKDKEKLDYESLHSGESSISTAAVYAQYKKYEDQRKIKVTGGEYLEASHGSEINMDWIYNNSTSLTVPIAVRASKGGIKSLGGEMPDPKTLTINEIARLNGRDTKIEVVDCQSQSSSKTPPGSQTGSGWSLGQWADYFSSVERGKAGGKVYNVISYEISGSPCGVLVKPPHIVSEIDWAKNVWPSSNASLRPTVGLYCLMSPAGCWTDWHIDFAGSSVWYHVLEGEKVFYFIKPTPHNLRAYTHWSSSPSQTQKWLGESCAAGGEGVFKVTLKQGDTMFIPSGWIHSVASPKNSLVFGGNFLHSRSIDMQLRIRDIELETRVPAKFRYPRFVKLCWYVADHYVRILRITQVLSRGTTSTPSKDAPKDVSVAPPVAVVAAAASSTSFDGLTETLTPRLLNNLLCLASFLVRQVRIKERNLPVASDSTNETPKQVMDSIPGDKIREPATLARELRWRVKAALGEESEDEDGTMGIRGEVHRAVIEEVKEGGSTKKRKRSSTSIKSVTPRKWEQQQRSPTMKSYKLLSLPDPRAAPAPVRGNSKGVGNSSSSSTIPHKSNQVTAFETTRVDQQTRTRRTDNGNGNIIIAVSREERTIVETQYGSEVMNLPDFIAFQTSNGDHALHRSNGALGTSHHQGGASSAVLPAAAGSSSNGSGPISHHPPNVVGVYELQPHQLSYENHNPSQQPQYQLHLHHPLHQHEPPLPDNIVVQQRPPPAAHTSTTTVQSTEDSNDDVAKQKTLEDEAEQERLQKEEDDRLFADMTTDDYPDTDVAMIDDQGGPGGMGQLFSKEQMMKG